MKTPNCESDLTGRRMHLIPCALLAAALLLPPPMLDAAPGNPLAGTWTMVIPDAAGGQHLYLQVRRDGTYTLYSTVYGSAGAFTVTPPNHWRMVARTTKYSDHGTYRLEGNGTLILTGRLGPGRWTRVRRRPYLLQRKVLGQRVPAAIPVVVKDVVAAARSRWHRDAVPVALSVDPQPTASIQESRAFGIPYFSVTVTVYSPSTNSAWEVAISPYSYRARRISTGQLPKSPLAAKFVDLSKAIRTARQHGLRTAFKQASMINWEHWGSVWQIDAGPPDGDVTSSVQVLSSGSVVPAGSGPMSDYPAQYNAQWAQAVAGISRLIHRASGGGSNGGCPPFCLVSRDPPGCIDMTGAGLGPDAP